MRVLILLAIVYLSFSSLSGESEPVSESLAGEVPYIYAGRLFVATSETSSKLSGSGTAVGPGVVLTAAHVYWFNAWVDGALPDGVTPWRAYREWHPGVSSENGESFSNVASVVSLSGYDDALHEYDQNLGDNTSPFEAFNRDSLLLIFSDDTATPNGFQRYHPQAAESGFLGQRNFFEVVGYPSAKYVGSDSRKWLVHATTDKDPLVVSKVPSLVYDAGYTYENRLFTGGDPLDSYAGNSGGPVNARANAAADWLLVGVYVGSSALFRGMDAELAGMIDAGVATQIAETSPRFRFTGTNFNLAEGDAPIAIGVERLGDATGPASVDLIVVDLSKDEGNDFTHEFNLQWGAGELGVKNITVSAIDDELREGTEKHVLLLDGDLKSLDSPNAAVVTLEDNDLNGPLDQWTIIDEVGAVNYSEVVFAEGMFVSVGATNAVYWSPDYQDVGVMEFPDLNRLFQLTYARGLFIGSGDGPQLIVSEDGRTWDIVELPTSVSLFSLQYGHGLFVAAGGIDASSSSQGEVWVSEDARNWTKTYDEQHDRFDDVEFGNGIFLAKTGTDIYQSNDGLSWFKLETSGLGGIPSDLEFGAGRYVNVGRLGGIHYSENGVEWTQVRQEDEEAWYGVSYRNGYFVSTGISGKLATSSDGGLTWIDRFPNTQNSLWHGVTAVGKIVVIGDNGHLMEASLPEFFDFTFQPVDQLVDEGDTANLFADFLSSKNGPYTLQWQKDGNDLIGETFTTLSISNVGPGDEGNYQLIISGDGTEYASAIARLDIAFRLNPPENVMATTSTSRGVMLSWDDASSGETRYRIERRIVGREMWEVVIHLDENSTSYTDLRLTPDTEYEYRVSTISEGSPDLQAITTVMTLPATNFANLSTRGLVGKDDDVMIGGFTIPPGGEMTLYIRGLGPSLQSSGILNTISDPQLKLVRAPLGPSFEITNSNWMDADNFDVIADSGLPPVDDRESAIFATLSPGGYTVILSSEVEEDPAVGMIEIYDITENCADCRIINLSTRAMVSVGNDLMIGGLVISGVAEKQIYVRALGPSLSGIVSALQDPFLKMVSGEGEEASLDSWLNSQNADRILELGLPPTDDREVAELYQFQQGTYTFQVSGVDNTSGIALLEIFEVE